MRIRKTILGLSLFASLSVPIATIAAPTAFSPEFVTDQITVGGNVEHKLTLTVGDLKKFAVHGGDDISITGHSGAELERLARVKGVLLRDLLQKAEIKVEGHNDVKKTLIIAGASDGYKVVFSWSEIFNSSIGDGVLVLFEENGKPLADEEGHIALISGLDTRTGPRHVKWLKSIEVRRIVDLPNGSSGISPPSE